MKAYREKNSLTNPIYKQNQEQTKLFEKIVEKPTINYDKLSQSMLRTIQDRPLMRFEEQKSILDEEPVVEYPDQSSDDEEIKTDQIERISYHKIGKNRFMRIRTVKNISDLNNEELQDYVEEYGKELDKFRAHMRKERVTNTMVTRGTYWDHKKNFRKS